MFVLCIDILYIELSYQARINVFIDSIFRCLGLHFDMIVNQNWRQLYNSKMRIILKFKVDLVLNIRCNNNYTEFSQLKNSAASLYFQGLPGISENQALENHAELNNYTF